MRVIFTRTFRHSSHLMHAYIRVISFITFAKLFFLNLAFWVLYEKLHVYTTTVTNVSFETETKHCKLNNNNQNNTLIVGAMKSNWCALKTNHWPLTFVFYSLFIKNKCAISIMKIASISIFFIETDNNCDGLVAILK